jgi:hypothetical protein
MEIRKTARRTHGGFKIFLAALRRGSHGRGTEMSDVGASTF